MDQKEVDCGNLWTVQLPKVLCQVPKVCWVVKDDALWYIPFNLPWGFKFSLKYGIYPHYIHLAAQRNNSLILVKRHLHLKCRWFIYFIKSNYVINFVFLGCQKWLSYRFRTDVVIHLLVQTKGPTVNVYTYRDRMASHHHLMQVQKLVKVNTDGRRPVVTYLTSRNCKVKNNTSESTDSHFTSNKVYNVLGSLHLLSRSKINVTPCVFGFYARMMNGRDFPLLEAGMNRGNMLARLHYQSLVDPTLAGSSGWLTGNTILLEKGREGINERGFLKENWKMAAFSVTEGITEEEFSM